MSNIFLHRATDIKIIYLPYSFFANWKTLIRAVRGAFVNEFFLAQNKGISPRNDNDASSISRVGLKLSYISHLREKNFFHKSFFIVIWSLLLYIIDCCTIFYFLRVNFTEVI